MNESEPGRHFHRAVGENLRLWQERTAGVDDAAIRGLVAVLPAIWHAIRYGLAIPAYRLEAIQLLRQVHRPAERGGLWEAWLELCQRALPYCRSDNWQLRAQLLNKQGVMWRRVGRLPEAIAAHRQAEELAREYDDQLLAAQAEYHLGLDLLQGHKLAEAETAGQVALAIFAEREPGSAWHASTLNLLGDATRLQGDAAAAIPYLTEAVAYYRQLGDTTDLARTLNNLGLARQAQQQWTEAENCYQEALEQLVDTGSELTKSLIQCNYGVLYYLKGAFLEAELLFREADSLALRQSGNLSLRARLSQNLGNSLLKQGSYVEAEVHLERAISFWEQLNDDLERANSLGTLAEVHGCQEKRESADRLYEQALELLAQHPNHPWAQRLTREFREQQAALKVNPSGDGPSPEG